MELRVASVLPIHLVPLIAADQSVLQMMIVQLSVLSTLTVSFPPERVSITSANADQDTLVIDAMEYHPLLANHPIAHSLMQYATTKTDVFVLLVFPVLTARLLLLLIASMLPL